MLGEEEFKQMRQADARDEDDKKMLSGAECEQMLIEWYYTSSRFFLNSVIVDNKINTKSARESCVFVLLGNSCYHKINGILYLK
jgi:hypothetical protein